ncbi:hypothetical protein [Burkholderia anthina]|uniref:hypothetical protein n=1 Tax=Burkholderia anthina TaxID=179879 RepID=UPI0037BE5EC3
MTTMTPNQQSILDLVRSNQRGLALIWGTAALICFAVIGFGWSGSSVHDRAWLVGQAIVLLAGLAACSVRMHKSFEEASRFVLRYPQLEEEQRQREAWRAQQRRAQERRALQRR